MSAFTGQQLCIPPNKAYSGSTGYGCFAYIPLLWFEDGRTINTEDFYRLNDHFYTRPGEPVYLSCSSCSSSSSVLLPSFFDILPVIPVEHHKGYCQVFSALCIPVKHANPPSIPYINHSSRLHPS